MYVAPDSDIWLLKDIPLDNSYEHTLYFGSKSAQTSYFTSNAKYHLTEYSYQRNQRGYVRCSQPVNNLYDCNYMAYRNTAFGNKIFYAFILSADYVNNGCSEIRFEIDVMQTWYFDYELGQCFIERTHTKTDYIGDNLVPEPVELGEYVMTSYDKIIDLDDGAIVVAVLDTNDATAGKMYNHIFGGASLYIYDTAHSDGVVELLNSYLQQTDNVISVYMCPKSILGDATLNTGMPMSGGRQAKQLSYVGSRLNTTSRLDGFKPNNCKMYTYPYTYFHVDNGAGDSLSLRYEFFGDSKPSVITQACFTQPVEIILHPSYYKGSGTAPNSDAGLYRHPYFPEGIKLDGYPLCSWKVDSYQAWLAQNSIPLAVDAGSSVLSSAIGGAMMGAQGGVIGIAGGVAAGTLVGSITSAKEVMMQGYKASIASDQIRGSFSSSGANFAGFWKNFYGGQCSVNHQTAEIIDNFFDVYGYAYHRREVPVLNNRPQWTYLKTANTNIIGSVPNDDCNQIVKIYEKGVTFWVNPANVGEYGLANFATNRGVKPSTATEGGENIGEEA